MPMGGDGSREVLRQVVRVLALAPIGTGAAAALFGTAIIPDVKSVDPSVESEMRFFAVWWVGAGIYLYTLAARIEVAGKELRVLCALLFSSGCVRWLSVAVDGWPHPIFVTLASVEVALPVLLVVWQSKVAAPANA